MRESVATSDVAAAGNGATAIPDRARRGKPRIQTKEEPTAAAPVLDLPAFDAQGLSDGFKLVKVERQFG